MKMPPWIYALIPRPYPNPGTGNYAFQQMTAPPTFDVRGSGRPIAGQLLAFAPQIVQTPVVTPEGFGGLFHGQYVSQPLLIPDNNQ